MGAGWIVYHTVKPRPSLSAPLDCLIRTQQKFPPEVIRALQDLRLASAVEFAHFTAKGRYWKPGRQAFRTRKRAAVSRWDRLGKKLCAEGSIGTKRVYTPNRRRSKKLIPYQRGAGNEFF